MSAQHSTIRAERWPRWWRMAVIGLAMLILCSCRGVPKAHMPQTSPSMQTLGYDTLPSSAWTGGPEGTCAVGEPQGPWAPPGLKRPWPRDEYLKDGGDRGIRARVRKDWQIDGLELEDTVAHFDTLDGETIVEPSNRVHLYAPRFGAVRKEVGVDGLQIKEALVRYDVRLEPAVDEDILVPGTTAQHVQTERQVNAKRVRSQQRNAPSQVAANAKGLWEQINRQKLLVNRDALLDGTLLQTDEPQLAIKVQQAITWTHDKAVQVILDDQWASAEIGDARAHAVFAIGHEGTPKLRIVKSASTDVATPGTIVKFTLQFDNVGTETIGNVTIVDNLTTRLEYVPDSQSSSQEADFLTEPNDGDSVVLRWEIIDPLPAGEGGSIQFECRVR